jgi:hypothetical protein
MELAENYAFDRFIFQKTFTVNCIKIELAQGKIQWQTLVYTVVKLWNQLNYNELVKKDYISWFCITFAVYVQL